MHFLNNDVGLLVDI